MAKKVTSDRGDECIVWIVSRLEQKPYDHGNQSMETAFADLKMETSSESW
jgi:hypothetical protein